MTKHLPPPFVYRKRVWFFLLLFVALPNLVFSRAAQKQEANSEIGDIQEILNEQGSDTSALEEKKTASAGQAKILRWNLAAGEILQVKKDSEQFILLNARKIQRQVNHRILLNVETVSEQGYQLAGTFASSFRYFLKTAVPYQEEESFYSRFYLRPRGDMQVGENFYMPNIRSLPTFPPDADPSLPETMPEGFTWNAAGEEVLLANSAFIRIPLDVFYEYHGRTQIRNHEGKIKSMHKIFMNYQIDYRSANKKSTGEIQSMYGYASVHMLWDEEAGIPYKASEVYDVMIRYGDGQFHEFRIKSQSDYKKIKAMTQAEKYALQNSLKEKISRFQKADEPKSEVRIQKQGLSVQLPQILFDYDSDKLTNKSKQILREIVAVLQKYPERYFVIRGHTDNVGSEDYNQKLSAARAKSVAAFIMEISKIPPNHLSYEGVGFREPVATNSNEQGRAQNRRVEIFIPEK